MENPEANQLPEVDSLPDGFVESPPEPLAPPTPTFEQEKPLDNREDDIASDIDSSKEPVEELAADEFQTSQGRAEKTQKLRTFPVPLSETDSSDVSVESVQVPKRASTEQTEEGGTLVMPHSADSVSETSVGVPECSEVKEQVEARCQSSERRKYLYLCDFPFLKNLSQNVYYYIWSFSFDLLTLVCHPHFSLLFSD